MGKIKELSQLILALIFLTFVILAIGFTFYTVLFPNEFGCRLLGVGGVGNVPANCIRYFVK